MEDNYGTWLLISGIVPVVFTLIGHFSGRKLPTNLRKHRFRRFAAIGLAAMIFSFSINRPFVSSYSFANTREWKMYPPTETENLKEFQKEQAESVIFSRKRLPN